MNFGILNQRLALRRQAYPPRKGSKQLAAFAESEAKRVRKADKVCNTIMEFWTESKMPHVDQIAGMQYNRGVLTVKVRGSSIAYEIDRALRCGMHAETVKKTPATLTRIKVVQDGT